VALVRAIVERESNWRVCAVSPKGAVGLMQLMRRLLGDWASVIAAISIKNVSGGVRYLAWLMKQFHDCGWSRLPILPGNA